MNTQHLFMLHFGVIIALCVNIYIKRIRARRYKPLYKASCKTINGIKITAHGHTQAEAQQRLDKMLYPRGRK